MKANRKFVDGEEAVSAVIGVILMVAITVAIAATVYVYVSGMLGESPETTPNLQLVRDNSLNTLVVSSADSDLMWTDFVLTINRTLSSAVVLSPTTIGTGTTTGVTFSTTAEVTAGDIFTFSDPSPDGPFTVTVRHIPTNTLVGTYEYA